MPWRRRLWGKSRSYKLEMKKRFYTTIALCFCLHTLTFGQFFDRNYAGNWASTSWEFKFTSNGKYTRISQGHFGNTVAKGKYRIIGDTIELTSGYKKTAGTVNQFYLMEGDSVIIDLYLRYDYRRVKKKRYWYTASRKRKIKYPQTQTDNEEIKSELNKVLNVAFNSSEMRKYYHFDSLDRELIIARYDSLDTKIVVNGKKSVFLNKDKIEDGFYIEFRDINVNPNSIDLKIKIADEGVEVWFYFFKVKENWEFRKPDVFER